MITPHKPIRFLQTLLILLFTFGSAIAASAHSFNTVMLLPASAADKALRDDLMQAFLLASEERDRHPDETSDGHLGGLDVFITFATNPDQIEAANPDIIATPMMGVVLPDTTASAALRAPDLAGQDAITMLATAAGPSLPPFAQRFQAITGRMPGPEAKAVYVTARIIGRAVREAGGMENPTLLRTLLSP